MANCPLIDVQIREEFKKIIEAGDMERIFVELLEPHSTQKIQLTDEEIRATVKKIIETGDALWIFALLEGYFYTREDLQKMKKLKEPTDLHYIQNIQLIYEEIRAAVKKIIETGDAHWICKLLEMHFDQQIQLTYEEIRAVIKNVIKKGDVRMSHFLVTAYSSSNVQLIDGEIRAAVKKIIEKGNRTEIGDLLQADVDQEVQLTDMETRDAHLILTLLKWQWRHVDLEVQLRIYGEIRAVVRRIIELGNVKAIINLLDALVDQRIQLTYEEIRAVINNIIGKGNEEEIRNLLQVHVKQKVQLTDEEIRDIVRKYLFDFSQKIINLVRVYFRKSTQMQIVNFVKEMTPDKMTSSFLMDCSQELDANRFQWMIEASPPLCIRSLWKEYSTRLSQGKRIIVSINVARQKLMFILQKRLCRSLPTNFVLFTLIQFLNFAPWQNLKCLLPESDG
jgi:hypothetical protein